MKRLEYTPVKTLANTTMAMSAFPGEAPAVDAEHCLNRRYKQIECRQCVDACPMHAIRLEEGAPFLNESLCTRCGACMHACPTEVFADSNPLESRLRASATSITERSIALVCRQHASPHLTSTPAEVVLRHVRCLAALSVDDLLALSQDGERNLYLDDTPCSDCPLATNRTGIERRATQADALLAAVGRRNRVALVSEVGSTDEGFVGRPVVEGSQPRVSRRNLFTRFLAPAAMPPIVDAPEPLPTRWSKGNRLPPRRSALMERLRAWTSLRDAITTPFRTLHVEGERCTACELCARLCPTFALEFVKIDEAFALGFEAARCVECELCVAACPEGIVQLTEGLTFDALIGEQTVLASGVTTPCQHCGAPTVLRAEDDAPLCFTCRQQPETVRPGRDRSGMVADLFRREQALQSELKNDVFNPDKHLT